MDNLMFKIEIAGLGDEVKRLGELKNELEKLAVDKKALRKEYELGAKTESQYTQGLGELKIQTDAVNKEASYLNKSINAQAASFKGAEGSMARMSYELGDLKTRYRNLSEEQRNNQLVGGKMLTQINKLDGEVKKLDATIGNHQRNVGNYGSGLDQLKGAYLGVVAGITGVIAAGSKIISFMTDAVQEAGKEEAAQRKLSTALGYHSKALLDLASAKQKTTTFGDDQTVEAMAYLSYMGLTERQIIKLIPLIQDMATAKSMDLTQAADLVARSVGSSTNALVRYGIEIEGAAGSTERMDSTVDALTKKFEGQAEAVASVGVGAIQQFTNVWSDFKETLGREVLPAINEVVKALNQLFQPREERGVTMLKDAVAELIKMREEELAKGEEANKYMLASYDRTIKAQKTEIFLAETRQKIRQEEATLQYMMTEDYAKSVRAQMDADTKARFDANKAKADEQKKEWEKYQKEYETALDKRAKTVEDNEKYITKLTQQYHDLQISSMLDGVAKQQSAEENRWSKEKQSIQDEEAAKIKAIDESISTILAKKGKATQEERSQLEELNQQISDIINTRQQVLEAGEMAHQKSMNDIIKKASKKDLEVFVKTLDTKSDLYQRAQAQLSKLEQTEDDKITTKYKDGIAKVEEESNIKLSALRAYYSAKGILTEGEEQKLALEEKKLALEVFTKKAELLKTEIDARRELGTITQEQYQAEMQSLATMYVQIRGMQDELSGGKKGEEEGGITSWVGQVLFGDEEKFQQEIQMVIGQVEQLLNTLVDMYYQSQQQRIINELNNEKKKLDRQQSNELKKLEDSRRRGLITEEEYKAQKEKLDEKYNQKRIAAEKKAFEQQKKLQKTMIWINAAMAIIKSIAEYGFIIGAIMGALILITAGIQVAAIDKQQFPEYAKGGLVRGRSHAEGGETFAVGNSLAELEGGEGVVNRRSMESSDILSIVGTPRELTSYANSYKGNGVPFAVGGYIPAATPTRGSSSFMTNAMSPDDLALRIGAVLNSQKVYVVESDITDTQGRVKKISVESEW